MSEEGPRILLVEDNEHNRDMLSRRLRRRGFRIELAQDGGQALEMAATGAPDLILLDLDLPVVDGWEVARRLKSTENTRNIKILALTAHAMDGERKRALDAGCDEYDSKPVDLERLLGKIAALLP